MTNSELHTFIATNEAEIARLQSTIEEVRHNQMARPDADAYGNLTAEHGCDRCECGCKYWEFDRCIDCGEMHKVEKN